MQVLQYMRTDTYVEKEEVVATVFEDIASGLTFSCAQIKASIEAGGYGVYKKLSKDFRAPTATTTIFTRGRSAWKRKCCAVRLSCLPRDVQSQLKTGKMSMAYHCFTESYVS